MKQDNLCFDGLPVVQCSDTELVLLGEKRESAVKPSAGCNWRHKRHYWNKVSKYNGGSSSRNCVPFKDPLGRPKPKKAWVSMTVNTATLMNIKDFNGGPLLLEEVKVYITGKGPTWLFDLDYLTDSMNYQPMRSKNQANKHAGPKEANHSVGTEDNINAGNSEIEAESAQDYFVLPIWSSYTSTFKSSKAKNAGEEPNKNPDLKTDEKLVDKEDQVFLDELERLKRQEQDTNDAAEALRKEFTKDTEDLLLQAGAAKASSTNTVNNASTQFSTAILIGGTSFIDTDQDDSEIPALEDI
ncbi:hypothetical protein Tco_1504385 [Tanacetum coccineum]